MILPSLHFPVLDAKEADATRIEDVQAAMQEALVAQAIELARTTPEVGPADDLDAIRERLAKVEPVAKHTKARSEKAMKSVAKKVAEAGVLDRAHVEELRRAGCTRDQAVTAIYLMAGPALGARIEDDLDSYGPWSLDPVAE